MFYQMLSGQPPFVSEGLGELVLKHMMEKPRPLREVVPGLSPGLEALVHAMLAKTPAERPSMAQVLGEINNLGQNVPGWASTLRPPEPISVYPVGPGPLPVQHPSTLGQSAGQRLPAFLTGGATGPGAARTRALIGSAVAGLLVVGAVVMALPKHNRAADGPLGSPPVGSVPSGPSAGTRSLPGMTISSGRVDPASVDLASFTQLALREAQGRVPDAALTSLLARCVQPSGIANLGLCNGVLVYTFRSPSKSARGNTPIGVQLPCLVRVMLQPQVGLIVQDATSEHCDEKLVQKQHCQPADIWRRAIKAGAPENAIADVSLIEGKWYITVDGKSQIFPDDC